MWGLLPEPGLEPGDPLNSQPLDYRKQPPLDTQHAF